MKPVLTFLSTVSILWGSVVSIEASKPNIVLILADDLGWGEISCQGGKVPTPHIDRLAESGQRWTRFYTNSSVCSPTRASLLTGRYPQRAGITHALVQPIEGHEGLAPEEWTLAEALREDGYHTGLIGKWHLGSAPDRQPQAQGFDEFKGCLSGMIDHTSHADKMGEVDWWHGTERNLEKGYVTHLIARHSVEFVRQNAEREKPFFLFVSFTTPHSPYTAPGAEPVWKLGQENRGDNVREPGAKEGREALVREMDLAVGSVMQALRESGAVDNTLVVFLSDNGAPGQYNRAEFFVGDNGGLRGQKFDAWEGGIRVPAIFHWPGKIAPGAIHEPGITMDLMPTFLALAGVEARPPKPFDGIDLTDSLLEGKEPLTRDLYWMIRPYAAVSSQGRKLVVTERLAGARAGEELFDLAQDEKETSDLSGREPERKASLRKKLETWQDEVRRPGRQQTNPRDYGAAGDGKKLDTHALQQAIDVCYRRGGGVVRVPPGTYRCGTVELRSDVTLHLEKGAVIKGSGDLKDYLQFEGTTERSGLLLALNVERIRIEGEGTIDGNSSAFALDEVKFAQEVKTAIPYTRQRDTYLCPPDPRVTTPLITKARPPFMLTFAGCRDVQVEGVQLANAPAFTVLVINSEKVMFNDCTLRADMRLPNVDGIHVDDSSDITIAHCDIRTPDDCIAFTNFVRLGRWMLPESAGVRRLSAGRTEKVRVSNCTLQSNSSAIRVGHVQSKIRDAEFRDITICKSNRGIGLFVRGPAVLEDIRFKDIRIETSLHSGTWWGNGEAIHLSVGRGFDPNAKLGSMKGVSFENITAKSETGILLWGDPASPIRDVSFRNVKLTVAPGPLASAKGGNYDLRPMADDSRNLFQHDIHALHARHVSGLVVQGLDVAWKGAVPDFYGETVLIENSTEVELDAVHDGSPERKPGAPAVRTVDHLSP